MLKNLLQLPRICRRKAYRQQFLSLPRMASFIATSNEREILTDPTGSRRFLCVEINNPIDCSPIDHAQLFAQLNAELLKGAPTFLSLEFEERLQAQNRSFQVLSPAAEVFSKSFVSLLPTKSPSPSLPPPSSKNFAAVIPPRSVPPTPSPSAASSAASASSRAAARRGVCIGW